MQNCRRKIKPLCWKGFVQIPVQLSTSPLDLTMLRTRRSPKYATHNDWVIVWEKRPAAEDAGEDAAFSRLRFHPAASHICTAKRIQGQTAKARCMRMSHMLQLQNEMQGSTLCRDYVPLPPCAEKGWRAAVIHPVLQQQRTKTRTRLVLFFYFWLVDMQKKHLSLTAEWITP